jgi:hypothetical protein
MGLDTTHDAWHGAYSAFMRWREKIAEVAGLPPLRLMEGFYVPIDTKFGSELGIPTIFLGRGYDDEMARNSVRSIEAGLPIKWDCLKPSALHELLFHSDCDGEIPTESCGPIADALEKLIPLLPPGDTPGHIGNWRDKTAKFVEGLRKAAAAGEPLGFH